MNWKRRTVITFLILAALWILIAPLLPKLLVVQKPLEKADAIVLLSGSAEFVERAREAAKLFRKGISPKIFLTDDGVKGPWYRELKRNPKTVERSRWELVGLGVSEDAIEILPTMVSGTNEEAEIVAKAVAKKGVRSVILVTSAYHSRRAFSSFEQVVRREGLPLTIGMQSTSDRPGSFWWLTAKGWSTVGLEWIKTAYYQVSY